MEEINLQGKDLLTTLTKVVEYEKDWKYRILNEERERIAREMKVRGEPHDKIAEITKLDLTEIESIQVNRLKELLYYKLRLEDEIKRSE